MRYCNGATTAVAVAAQMKEPSFMNDQKDEMTSA